MALDPTERVALGRTGLTVTRLGFGGASIGGLFSAVDDDDSDRDGPPRLGPRHPHVRHRPALRLRRIGAADGTGPARPAAGRIRAVDQGRPAGPPRIRDPRRGRRRPAAPWDDRTTRSTSGPSPVRIVFDYSADGVRRSLEESLERLGLDRIDIALIHDPDDHWQDAIDGAWPALARLRVRGRRRARSARA